MPKAIPPQITEFLEGATIYTYCTLISIALSRYGTDPLSQLIHSWIFFLFTTIPGGLLLCTLFALRFAPWPITWVRRG